MRFYRKRALYLLLIMGGCAAPRPPQTPVVSVADTYHGVRIGDPYAQSKDDTRVLLSIFRRKGIALDGSHPLLLTGYGGYRLSFTPSGHALNRVRIEQGGMCAIASLRGGGEHGEQWHRTGMLTSKQNVLDDFAAAMQDMIDAGHKRPEKMAIHLFLSEA
jgi:prolyl oligopeptidase PreP (S9A serine peptidase family)